MVQMIFAAVASVIMSVLAPSLLLSSPLEHEQSSVVLMIDEEAEHDKRLITLQSQNGIRQMPLEEYLVGVVSSEMLDSFHEEALKAQAVAARTFTMYRIKNPKHAEAAVCADSSCCQAWSDTSELSMELNQKARQAVYETKGEYLTYHGALIETPFFSCSGGKTEAAVAVWGTDIPYLRSVESRGEENASRFESEIEISVEEFKNTLLNHDSTISLSGPAEEWVGTITYTSGGGADTIEIGGKEFRGTEIRSLFGLNSTAFTVELQDNNFLFRTKGFGHRVGMSQYGANAMAEGGADYTEILKHYYQGVEIKK